MNNSNVVILSDLFATAPTEASIEGMEQAFVKVEVKDLQAESSVHEEEYPLMGTLVSSRTSLVSFCMIITLLLASATSVFAQSKALVKNVNFELVNNELIITYDITKHKPAEMFKVWMKVYTAQENELKSESASGAIGENVAGGDHKKIIWNPKNDNVFLDNDIYIQILATSTSGGGGGSDVSTGKWLAISALYPGAGNAKVSSNKVWLAAGALGYGCMVGSVLMNGKASKSYDNYLLSQDASTRNNFYNDADSQKQLSTILFVSGAVIWAADLIIFSVSKGKSGGSANSLTNKPVYLGYSNEAIDGYYTQRLSLNISF